MAARNQKILIYNSASIHYACKIPTVTPMFSWSRNSTKLFSILYDAFGSKKSKMAAHKQEYLYLTCTQRSCTILTALYMFLSPWIQWGYFLYCVMQAEVRNPRWWLTKTGYSHFSECTQRSSPIPTTIFMYIHAQDLNDAILYISQCEQKSEIQEGGL